MLRSFLSDIYFLVSSKVEFLLHKKTLDFLLLYGESVIPVQHIYRKLLTKREVKVSGYRPRSFLCFCVRVCVYLFNEPRRTRGQ